MLDFNDRLVTSLTSLPTDFEHPIGAYVTSEMGAALVLDQGVNRPELVSDDFGSSLEKFYASHPDAGSDPATWNSGNRLAYEKSIAQNNTALRHATDSAQRAAKLAKQNLSTAPGSLRLPKR